MNRLDAIALEHPEVNDTAVREEMSTAILNGFFRKTEDYRLLDKFAMYSTKGNIDVMVALAYFIGNARFVAGLDTFHQRMTAFQNPEIISENDHDYSYFFGHWNPEDFDKNGQRLDRRSI